MRKSIRILEVPLLLMAIAIATLNEGNYTLGIILLIISVLRLIVNHITDDSIYKNKENIK